MLLSMHQMHLESNPRQAHGVSPYIKGSWYFRQTDQYAPWAQTTTSIAHLSHSVLPLTGDRTLLQPSKGCLSTPGHPTSTTKWFISRFQIIVFSSISSLWLNSTSTINVMPRVNMNPGDTCRIKLQALVTSQGKLPLIPSTKHLGTGHWCCIQFLVEDPSGK